MLQIANLEEYTTTDIPKLLEKVRPILHKRKQLHDKYTRNASDSVVMYNQNNDATRLPFEKFITDLATGYLSGKPTYSVNVSKDEAQNEIVRELLGKEPITDDYARSLQSIIKYVTDYNDDETENHDLIHDILELTACYEILYENENNDIVYSRYDPLQTVATWDYSIPANLTGFVRTWTQYDINGKPYDMVELTDRNGSRTYKVGSNEEVLEIDNNNHEWGDVPGFAVETDFAIFESCEDVIQAYEQLIQNVRNTYQYNDGDCKLIMTGYAPQYPPITYSEDGTPMNNPLRVAEDEYWKRAGTIYTNDNGSVSWLLKPVDANGVNTILKTYIDLMFQLAGIPNTSDLAFNSADLNASAIDRKFYIMNMSTSDTIAQLKKGYLRRFELICNRINLKKNTRFDFRDIVVEIPKNLPPNSDEMIDAMLKLNGLISKETIVNNLGYDYLVEKEKLEQEESDNLTKSIENYKLQMEAQSDVMNLNNDVQTANEQEENQDEIVDER